MLLSCAAGTSSYHGAPGFEECPAAMGANALALLPKLSSLCLKRVQPIVGDTLDGLDDLVCHALAVASINIAIHFPKQCHA